MNQDLQNTMNSLAGIPDLSTRIMILFPVLFILIIAMILIYLRMKEVEQ